MTDAASLQRATDGARAVIHLVAIIAGKPEDFRRIMEQGTHDQLLSNNGLYAELFRLQAEGYQ